MSNVCLSRSRCVGDFSGTYCTETGAAPDGDGVTDGAPDGDGDGVEIPPSTGTNSGLIIGLSVGGAALLILIIFLVLFCCYQMRNPSGYNNGPKG